MSPDAAPREVSLFENCDPWLQRTRVCYDDREALPSPDCLNRDHVCRDAARTSHYRDPLGERSSRERPFKDCNGQVNPGRPGVANQVDAWTGPSLEGKISRSGRIRRKIATVNVKAVLSAWD